METEAKKISIIKQIEMIVAILAGLATFVVGFYTIKKELFKGKGTVVGVVRDFRSQNPITEAKIEITDQNGQLLTTLKSGWDGEFTNELNEGIYVIKVFHPSYEPQISNINILRKETSKIEIALVPVRARETSRSTEAPTTTKKGSEVKDTLRKKALETGFDILKRKL